MSNRILSEVRKELPQADGIVRTERGWIASIKTEAGRGRVAMFCAQGTRATIHGGV